MGAGAHFVARGIDTQKALPEILKRAHAHTGAALVEIIQNCIVYNDGAFDGFTARDVEAEAQIHVRHGEPLLFGKDRGKGLRLGGGLRLEVTAADDPGVLRHDERSPLLATLLAMLEPPMPVAIGVIYDDPAETSWEATMRPQDRGAGPSLQEVMRQGATWTRPGAPPSSGS
jgi:2-oxoglutarate ferredoxin oxidoreductase subunit beta